MTDATAQFLAQCDIRAQDAIPFVKKHMEADIFKMQRILHLKSDWSGALERIDKEKFFTFRAGDKFGFGELMVNQLMTLAYAQGRIDGKDPAYQAGYDAAMKDVAAKLGLEYVD